MMRCHTRKTMDLRQKALQDMNKGQLREVLDALKIDYKDDDTNAVMVQRIEESGKYKASKETGTSGIKANEKGERVHPTLGKYYDVIIHPTAPQDQNTSIFVSINFYTAEFQPREKVSLPEKVIRFLKEPRIAEHYYDKNAITENGNIGAHMTRYVPKYIVEKAD